MKNRVPRRPKMKRICMRSVAKILREGGSMDERRMAAESCDSALKDAVRDCDRGLFGGEGRSRGLVKSLKSELPRQAELKPIHAALALLQDRAHGRGHHQSDPTELSDEALARFRGLVAKWDRPARLACRRILIGGIRP
jgi:hypothetical protein